MLAVSARAASLPLAVGTAYKGIGNIGFEGMQYRKDIAARALGPAARTAVKIGVLGSTKGSSLQPVIDAVAK